MKSEHQEQVEFVNWCKKLRKTHHEFNLLFAIPNGGSRNKLEASKLKLEGVEAGVPDLFLSVARHGKHGLYIEMKKRKGGALSPKQKKWRDMLKEEGYAWVRANGSDEAKHWIKKYLSIK